jgi:hypothetical protein
VNANGSDLRAASPNALVSPLRDPRGWNSEYRQRVNQRLFDAAKVRMYVAPPFSQIEYRIAHDLTRTMIRHIAPTVSLVVLDAAALEDLFRGQQMLGLSIPAHRNHMRVLDEQQRVDAFTLLPGFHKFLLNSERIRVPDSSEIHYFKRPHT